MLREGQLDAEQVAWSEDGLGVPWIRRVWGLGLGV